MGFLELQGLTVKQHVVLLSPILKQRTCVIHDVEGRVGDVVTSPNTR